MAELDAALAHDDPVQRRRSVAQALQGAFHRYGQIARRVKGSELTGADLLAPEPQP